jgi:hypothetical protein
VGVLGLDRKTVIVIPVGVRITAAGSRFGAARWTTLVLGCAPNHGSSPESRFRRGRITVSLERITVSITVFWWAGEHFSRACASGVQLPPPPTNPNKEPDEAQLYHSKRGINMRLLESLMQGPYGERVEIVEKLQNINDSIQTSKCIECIR